MICCDDKNRTGLNSEKDCDEHKKMLAQSFLTPWGNQKNTESHNFVLLLLWYDPTVNKIYKVIGR